MFGIVLHEVGPHERHVFRCAQRLGERPLDESQNAVADKMAILLIGVLRKTAERQHGVAGDGQVADRVEQRAVEIEDDKFRIHFADLIFQPTAATRSDMSGLTILKIQ